MPVDTEYYELLEVEVTADDASIKKSYRRLAIRYHPDKNPDNPQEAAQRFQKISEAYQVLSNPDLRSKYDKYGKDKAVPEQGFDDASDFFTTLFGGDAFVDIIGEIALAQDIAKAMEMEEERQTGVAGGGAGSSGTSTPGGTNSAGKSGDRREQITMGGESELETDRLAKESAEASKMTENEKQLRAQEKKKGRLSKEQLAQLQAYEKERAEKRRQRVEHLTKALVEKVSVYTEAEQSPELTEAFKAKIRIEAENLKYESFGVEILHAVGASYIQKATTFLKSQKLFGMGGFMSKMKEKGGIVKDTWNTISSALDVHQSAEELSKLEEQGGDDWTPERKAELEREVSGKMILACWRTTKLEFQDVLRDVCNRVLDPSLPKAKRIQRANALILIGLIYRSVEPDEDDQSRVFAELMAEIQRNKKKKKHQHHHKKDKSEANTPPSSTPSPAPQQQKT